MSERPGIAIVNNLDIAVAGPAIKLARDRTAYCYRGLAGVGKMEIGPHF